MCVSVFIFSFLCISSHHFNPILREYETMVWFFISQKKNFPWTRTLTSLFAFIFHKLILLCIEHSSSLGTYYFFFLFVFTFHIEQRIKSNFFSCALRCTLSVLKLQLNKNTTNMQLDLFVYLCDSKLRFAHRSEFSKANLCITLCIQ